MEETGSWTEATEGGWVGLGGGPGCGGGGPWFEGGGPGCGEVDHVVEEVHSRGYIFADDKTPGPDPGWCYNSEEVFAEVDDFDKDGVNGRHS